MNFTKIILDIGGKVELLRAWLKLLLKKDSLLYHWLRAPSMAARKIFTNTRKLTGDGMFYLEKELAMCSLRPKAILDEVLLAFQPVSVLDLGCGTGQALEYFIQNGVHALGVEGSKLAISKSHSPDCIFQWDLRTPLSLGRTFDLVWCFEVVEHLPEKFADVLVHSMTLHSNLVVLSAAHPGQGGEGHFNEQRPEYWIAKFNQHSFSLQEDVTEKLRQCDPYWGPNLMVFRRRTETS